MSDLIDAATMQSLIELDESAMPSRATIRYRAVIDTPTGGTQQGPWVDRNATPIRCRFVPNSPRSSILGERLQTVADGALQLSLAGVASQSVTIDDDDVIIVSTVLPLPGADYAETATYRVSGEPFIGSYSTNLTVPVSKVG